MTENSELIIDSIDVSNDTLTGYAIGPVWPVRKGDGSYMLYTSKPDGYVAQRSSAASLARESLLYWRKDPKDLPSNPTEAQSPAPPPPDSQLTDLEP